MLSVQAVGWHSSANGAGHRKTPTRKPWDCHHSCLRCLASVMAESSWCAPLLRDTCQAWRQRGQPLSESGLCPACPASCLRMACFVVNPGNKECLFTPEKLFKNKWITQRRILEGTYLGHFYKNGERCSFSLSHLGCHDPSHLKSGFFPVFFMTRLLSFSNSCLCFNNIKDGSRG